MSNMKSSCPNTYWRVTLFTRTSCMTSRIMVPGLVQFFSKFWLGIIPN
jgi:hypothetical protein